MRTNESPPCTFLAPRSSRPIYLWNPVGFDPLACLGEPLKRRADLARFLLHKIHWNNVFSTSQYDGFVTLKAEYLRKFFPGNTVYRDVMERLIDSGVIVCDNSYVLGEKCYGFQLSPELYDMRSRGYRSRTPYCGGRSRPIGRRFRGRSRASIGTSMTTWKP